MKNTIIAGWDPGRLNNKLFMEDKKIINMNAICNGYERRILEEETGELKNYLDVEVYKDEEYLGRYFVGGMAYRFNRGDLRWSANGIPKFHDIENGNDEIIKLVTHLALAQYEPGQEKQVYFRLGTGAPTEEYFEKPDLLASFSAALRHEYRVAFKHPLHGGAVVKVKIPEVHFKPEGTASVVSMCYTDELQHKREIQKYLEKGYIIGMNIGSSTTDVAIMNSKMEFESAGFFGIPVGSSNALNEIRSLLYTDYGYDVTKVKLDYLIRNYQRIKYKGQVIELEEIAKRPIRNLISLLKTKFYDQIEMKGIELGEAGALFASGGTVLLAAKELETFIHGVQTAISVDPLFEDARGYFLEAKYYQQQETKAQQYVFQEDDEVEVQ